MPLIVKSGTKTQIDLLPLGGRVAGRNAYSHKASFGKSKPPEYRGNAEETSFDAGGTKPSYQILLRVDEASEEGTIEGKLRSFNTKRWASFTMKRQMP